MITEFGTVKLSNYGYYRVTSKKEGNCNKFLHRLLYCKYHNCALEDIDGLFIHHIDEDRTNNSKENLVAMTPAEHNSLHTKGRKLSEECKQKLSEMRRGKAHSKEHKKNLSKSQNSTGFYRVGKHGGKTYAQGFRWVYLYYKKGESKQSSIASVDLLKLKEKVLANGLEWCVLDHDKAKANCEKYGYNLEEVC